MSPEYQWSAVERVIAKLTALPEVERKLKTPQVIEMMAPAIEQMQTKGYSLAAISEVLSQEGFPMSVATLKTYLHARGTGKKKKRASPKRSEKADEPRTETRMAPPDVEPEDIANPARADAGPPQDGWGEEEPRAASEDGPRERIVAASS